jgi:hypothetical protein
MKKVKMRTAPALVSVRMIERRILFLRGEKVLLDSDLAELYGVTTKALNQGLKRNQDRFPKDFAFRLTKAEYSSLRSQFVTLEKGRGKHRKYLPYVFTEYGALMLANTLKSERAIQASIEIVRTFVRLRELLTTHADLSEKLRKLESKYNEKFSVVFEAIRQLMIPPEPRRKKIGFNTK